MNARKYRAVMDRQGGNGHDGQGRKKEFEI